MSHPLVRLISSHPQWVLEHAQAYAELTALECRSAASGWARRALWWGTTLASALVAVLLAGVALMLCALTAPTQMVAPWLLVLVPAVPAALALSGLLMLRLQRDAAAFEHLRLQLQADALMLREMQGP